MTGATNDLERANRDLLFVLATVLETRDPYTAGHSSRVARMAERLGKAIDMSEKDLRSLHTAALLHDIGKHERVFYPILMKKGPLSAAEKGVMKTHATAGGMFLERLSTLEPCVIEAVKHHHEHYDGSGYPKGLSGEEIPLMARIVGLCDAIEAMASDRAYRSALTSDHIRAELERCSGAQFDPRLAEIAIQNLDNLLSR